MVIASTLGTILIALGVVVLIAVVFLAFGPLRQGESVRDDVEADQLMRHGYELSPETEDEVRRVEGLTYDDEARLDRENE
jgi:hypothetical protein